jgi:twitching motility protein PilJ
MSFLNKLTGRDNARSEDTTEQDEVLTFDDVAQQRSAGDAPTGLPAGAVDVSGEHTETQQDGPIITEAAPSELTEFSETRIQGGEAAVAAAAAGSGLPLIGDKPVAEQQRILVWVIGLGLAGLVAMAALALNRANRESMQVAATGQALMQSQRLSRPRRHSWARPPPSPRCASRSRC